jgi:hypothetical protein
MRLGPPREQWDQGGVATGVGARGFAETPLIVTRENAIER